MKPHENNDDDDNEDLSTTATNYDASFSGFPGGFREWAGLVLRPSCAAAAAAATPPSPRCRADDAGAAAHFARERRDQGALRRALGGGHVFGLCVGGPAIAVAYAAAGLLAVLGAANGAELAARRPFAGPGGLVSLLLASVGPLPAAVAAASLLVQHVVVIAMVARAFVPAVAQVVAGGGGAAEAAAAAVVSSSSLPLSEAAVTARAMATTTMPATAVSDRLCALDPGAAILALLASMAAAALPARVVAWFCAAAGGGAALASATAAALTLAASKGQPLPPFSTTSSSASVADILLGSVAAAAGAALVSSLAAGGAVALPPAFADDARSPARAVPRGMLAAVGLAAVVQTVVALALGLPAKAATETATTTTAARLLFGLAAALASLAGAPALVLGASRVVCGAARHRLLPFAGFGRVSSLSLGCRGRLFFVRLRSPLAATGLVAAAAVPLALLLAATPASLGGLLAVGFLATQAMVAVAVLLERTREARAGVAMAEEQQEQQQQEQQPQERPPSARPPPPPPDSPSSSSSSSSADGRVSIRSASPSDESEDGARCGDPLWWSRGPGSTWVPRFLIGALVACACGAASALGAAASLGPPLSASAASPEDALWPLVALLGGWFVATALLHACTAATARANGCGNNNTSCSSSSFRAPFGPWLPSLSLFLFGVAGGAALPLSALLRWLLLVAAAVGLWLVYGLPAAQARATRWAAEDAAEEEARAAEAEEEGRRRRWAAEAEAAAAAGRTRQEQEAWLDQGREEESLTHTQLSFSRAQL